jgi:hypothetical protein
MRNCSPFRWWAVSALALTSVLLSASPAWSKDAGPVGTHLGRFDVIFGSPSGTLSVGETSSRNWLVRGRLRAKVTGKQVSWSDAKVSFLISPPGMLLSADDVKVTIALAADDETLEIKADGPLDGPAEFIADAADDIEWQPAIAKDQQGDDRKVLTMTFGPARVSRARSLFNPKKDILLMAGSEGGAAWQSRGRQSTGQWRLTCSAAAGKPLLKVSPNYYRDTLGVRYFRPIDKRSYWTTAPIVAMTWYGICGSKQPQSLDLLRPEIDWVAKHLLPYAERLVFQLDDNYPFADDRAMRALSDYIRSRGLIPGVWFTPYSTVPPDEATAIFQAHPDWFLVGADGKPLAVFAGKNWGGPLNRSSSYVVNVSQTEAAEEYFRPFWRRASDAWNYDFFKIDGQPSVADDYRAAANGGGTEGYRKGLEIGRQIVGPDKFINGCSGTKSLLDWVGPLDGSRTGPDTGNKPHAIDVILQWNFLNNVCWWCDPDAAANLFDKPVQSARINAQARCLTGQQFLTDDYWTKVPEPTTRVWQQSYPNLDVRPVNLYPIEGDWRPYDLFDLRIAKPWCTFDVAGLFNYGSTALTKTLDLGRLPLESPYVHVFEFWSQTYLGRYERAAKIPRSLAGNDGQLFAIVPAADDRPTLVSTGRHLSQGGLDLGDLQFERKGKGWTIHGKSEHLVADDPYVLTFANGAYRLAAGRSAAGKATCENNGDVARLTITPTASGSAEWEAVFEPLESAAASVRPQQ